jgi:hypothetical protein
LLVTLTFILLTVSEVFVRSGFPVCICWTVNERLLVLVKKKRSSQWQFRGSRLGSPYYSEYIDTGGLVDFWTALVAALWQLTRAYLEHTFRKIKHTYNSPALFGYRREKYGTSTNYTMLACYSCSLSIACRPVSVCLRLYQFQGLQDVSRMTLVTRVANVPCLAMAKLTHWTKEPSTEHTAD